MSGNEWPAPPSMPGPAAGSAGEEPLPTVLWSAPAPPVPVLPSVTVGTLLSRTFLTWRAGWRPFTLIALLSHVAALALGAAVGSPFIGSTRNPFSPPPEVTAFVGTRGYWLVFAGGLFFTALAASVTVAGALTLLDGGQPRLGVMLATGLRRLPSALGAAVLFILVFYAGLILLVVPGLLALAAFGLATTAAVAEPLGPWRAMGRSRRLTQGHRARLLGYFLVAMALSIAVSFGSVGLSLVSPILATVAQQVVALVTSPLVYLIGPVAYHDLRTLKEGAPVAHLRQVFD